MVLEVMPALGLALQRVCLPRGRAPMGSTDDEQQWMLAEGMQA